MPGCLGSAASSFCTLEVCAWGYSADMSGLSLPGSLDIYSDVSKPIIVRTMQQPTLIQTFGVRDLLSRLKTSFRFRGSLIQLPSPDSPLLSLYGFIFLVIISVERRGFHGIVVFCGLFLNLDIGIVVIKLFQLLKKS